MTTTIARAAGRTGELALRADGGHLELISNGVFLMDTRDGRSERLLVRAVVERSRHEVRRILIGGLGLGFTLAEALDTPGIDDIRVIECEPAVVEWNRTHAGAVTGGQVSAPGVQVDIADLTEWLRDPRTAERPFDGICLDIDNGPGWLVSDTNAWLYDDDGLTALRQRLAPGGVLTVWSAAPSPLFRARLGHHFGSVGTLDVEVERGEPDTIYLARR